MAEIRTLKTMDELHSLYEESNTHPVWLFKHSLTCSISDAAWQEFLRFAERENPEPETIFALIEIQNSRDLSAAFAEEQHVTHESPQAAILRAGKAIWHKSHWQITEDNLIFAQLKTAEGFEVKELDECW